MGRSIAQHSAEFSGSDFDEVLPVLMDVINGLIAQLSAPLLCIGIGVPGVVNNGDGTVVYVPRFDWRNIPLAQMLSEHYNVSTHVANDSQLASMALFADEPQRGGLATLIVSQTVGVGVVPGAIGAHYGSEIGYLRTRETETLDTRLGWTQVRERARELGAAYDSPYLRQDDLSYLHIRQGVENGDPGARHLHDELAEVVVEIFAWIIALVRPQNIALSGKIADLGYAFLDEILDRLGQFVMPRLIEETVFFCGRFAQPGVGGCGSQRHSARTGIGDGKLMRTITVMTNDATGIFQKTVLDGLHDTARHMDFEIAVVSTGQTDASPYDGDLQLDDSDGLVVIANAVSDAALRGVYQAELPITLVSHRHAELPIPAVMSDNSQGIRTLMAHLIGRCGRTRPVFIRGIPDQQDSQQRERAFRRELVRHNIPQEAARIINGEFSAEDAARAVQYLVESGFAFDCLIAADYVMGIAAYETLVDVGVRVPEQVSVVGYGDDPVAEAAGLTTVSANIRELGQRAARQIISQINGLHISGTTTINVDLILRASCGCRDEP